MNTKSPVIVLGTIEVGFNLEGDVAVEVRGNGLSDPQMAQLRKAFDAAAAAFITVFTAGRTRTGRFMAGRTDLSPELVKATEGSDRPLTTDKGDSNGPTTR